MFTITPDACLRGEDVDVEDTLRNFRVDFGRVAVLSHSRVVDQNVNATELVERSSDDRVAGFWIGDVAGGNDSRTRFIRSRGRTEVLTGQRRQRQPRPTPSEQFHAASSDPFGGAGYQNYLLSPMKARGRGPRHRHRL